MTPDPVTAPGADALHAGRWNEARSLFEAVLVEQEVPDARFGLAESLWWLGETRASVSAAELAYVGFRRASDNMEAARAAMWLCIAYKSNFGNDAAANGWVGRATRLLEDEDAGLMHGYLWLTAAYVAADPTDAVAFTEQALSVARTCDDRDLELCGLSQLGRALVRLGRIGEGMALVDEAMAGTLAGEYQSLDTVVYTSCDMLNACEAAADIERASQWCRVADDFTRMYGCPYLYAECRTMYGTVLAVTGDWLAAERELQAALDMSGDVAPVLHTRAIARLATLRVRQGRFEEAQALVARVEDDLLVALPLAELRLARGQAEVARAVLARWLERYGDEHHEAPAVRALMVEARLAAGQLDAPTAAELLTGAVDRFAIAGRPYEMARARLALARALAPSSADAAVLEARRALETFERLGAVSAVDEAAALLRSLGDVSRTGPKGTGVLTSRERDVLALMGHGLSNPEIAERLFISRKTAAHHVSSVLAKLGLRNRAEAAAYVANAATDG